MLEPSRAPAPPNQRPPRPPGKMNLLVRIISGILTIVLVLMVAAGATAGLLYHQFNRPGPLKVSRVVAIPKGEGRIEIARRLEREGVIDNRWTFIAGYLARNALADKKAEMKAGDYEIKKSASMAEVIDVLTQGHSILEKISIPEGLTSLQIVQRIKEEPDLTGDIETIPPEGSLLPDTYRFSKGMARSELVERMQSEMERFLTAAWERRSADVPVKSPQEAVILASIVEKETGRADERGHVASVFTNRLKKKMRLQSDPTVIYGIVGGQGTLGRPISRADLAQKTQHNTYQVEGLPPTPICNPGRPAIEATLNPDTTNDLYFVADGTGGHVFSDTLKEHNSAVGNLRKIEQERAKKAATDAPAAPATPAPPAGKKGAAGAPQAGKSPSGAAGGASGGTAPAATAPAIINAPATAPAAGAPAGNATGAGAAPGAAPATATGPGGIPIPSRKPKQN
jgi:UPF0755 protein